VLTHRWQGARRASIDNTTTHPRNDASSLRKRSAATVDIAGNACAAGVFANGAFEDRLAADIIAQLEDRRKAGYVDSESRILAIKKFSCPPASRLIGARQNRFFARIARR
jgi:hypothetical protein